MHFTNDKIKYDLSYLEQTDLSVRTLELVVENKGILTAQNITYSLINESTDLPFAIKSNSCGENLVGGGSCTITLSYVPKNNDPSDLPQDYAAKLAINYVKNPVGELGKYTSNYSFRSLRIEADFTPSSLYSFNYSTLTVGNKLSKNFTLTNTGYHSGLLKEIVFSNTIHCLKATSGNILDCGMSHSNFPFFVEDIDSCFGREVAGVDTTSSGETCSFSITFWPPLTLTDAGSFNFINTLQYDSHWKNQQNLKTINIGDIGSANYIQPGNLSLTKVETTLNNVTSTYFPLGVVSPYSVDIGDVGLVTDSNVPTTVKMTFTNVGATVVNVSSIVDGLGNIITEESTSFGYYKNIKSSSCTTVSPGSTCYILFNLIPISSGVLINDQMNMFDVLGSENYKRFIFNYNNGSSITDAGATISQSVMETRLKAELKGKALLRILSPSFINFYAVSGSSTTHTVTLSNVGTDSAVIPGAINQTWNPLSGYPHWAFHFVDNPSDPNDCGIFPSSGTNDRTLAVGATCNITIENQLPPTSKQTSYAYNTEYLRPFAPWLWYSAPVSSASLLFYYHPTLTSTETVTTNFISIKSTFTLPASIIPRYVFPKTSAIILRPQISYSEIVSTYPSAATLTAQTVSKKYFDYNNCPWSYAAGIISTTCPSGTSGFFKEYEKNYFFKSHLSLHHMEATFAAPTAEEYTIHAGTFPSGNSINFEFYLYNSGATIGKSFSLTDLGGNGQITLVTPISIPSYLNSNSSMQFRFNFNPGSSDTGLFSHCYSYSFFDGMETKSRKFCVYAEAEDPNLSSGTKMLTIEKSEDGGATYTDITSELNSYNAAKNARFEVVYGSGTTVTRRFRITNNRNVAINNLSVVYLENQTRTPLSGLLPSSITVSPAGTPCTLNMTLASGASCELDMTYAPTSIDSKAVYLGAIFEIDSYQYVFHTGALSFASIQPATFVVKNVTTLPGSNISPLSSITTASLTASGTYATKTVSYPVVMKNYDQANSTHRLLNSTPTITSFALKLTNSSTLKSTFAPSWMALNPEKIFPDDFPTNDEYIEIFKNDTVTISANRACFFGDDEYEASIPINAKGFNSLTQNICYLNLDFKGYRTYQAGCGISSMGGLISNSCNPFSYTLVYSSTNGVDTVPSKFNVHMEGYIEPNRLLADGEITNVSALSDGSISFNFPVTYPVNDSWGEIKKLLLCYDKDPTVLKTVKIFNLLSDYDINSDSYSSNVSGIGQCVAYDYTPGSVTSMRVAGLLQANYYFFKVYAIREFTDTDGTVLQYISNSPVSILTLPIPLSGQSYLHGNKILLDKTYKSDFLNRPNAMARCASDFSTFYITSESYKIYKKLINTSVFKSITSDPQLSTGYPTLGIGIVTHWLSDSSYDLSSTISLYDGTSLSGFPNYDYKNTDGSNATYSVAYHQTCNTSASCGTLYKLVGGDPSDGLYLDGTFYTTEDGAQAAVRCYSEILCPTDPSLLITSLSCQQP